jgi:hypothetical protein
MSTNISELLYRMERGGLSKSEANEIALKLIIAGQQSVVAARSEQALRRVVDHVGEEAASEVVTVLREIRS